MDVRTTLKVRDIIADEIVGCTFTDMDDAKQRVEEILAILEERDITWESRATTAPQAAAP